MLGKRVYKVIGNRSASRSKVGELMKKKKNISLAAGYKLTAGDEQFNIFYITPKV